MAQRTANAPVGTTRAANQRAYDRRQLIDEGLRTALGLLVEFGCHTFAQAKGKTRQRFDSKTSFAAAALMAYYFSGNPHQLLAARDLDDKVRTQVQQLFALVCERIGLTGTYGQRAAWYAEAHELAQRELKRARFNPGALISA